MNSKLLTAFFVIAAIFTASAQKEFYLLLDDSQRLTQKNKHGIMLETTYDGKQYGRPFVFSPGKMQVFFVPLDSCIQTPQQWVLTDSMIGLGDELEIIVYRAIDRTKNYPTTITPNDIPTLPPFLLSDGDRVEIRLKKIGETANK